MLRLKEAIAQSGMRTDMLAVKTGIDAATIWRHKTGKTSPTVVQLTAYSEALGIPISRLIDDNCQQSCHSCIGN